MRHIMEDSTNYSNAIHSHSILGPPATTATSSSRPRKGRRSSRQPQAPTQMVLEPTEWDVLCAKEKFAIVHKGTRRFRALIDDYQARYADAANKDDKMKITKEIVGIIERHGRFLRYMKESQTYEELTHLEARDKTSHALRTACKRFQRQKYSAPKQSATAPATAAAPLLVAPEPSPVRSSPSSSHENTTGVAMVSTKQPSTNPHQHHMPRPPIVRRFTTNELAPLPLHSAAGRIEDDNGPSTDDFLSLLKRQVFDDE